MRRQYRVSGYSEPFEKDVVCLTGAVKTVHTFAMETTSQEVNASRSPFHKPKAHTKNEDEIKDPIMIHANHDIASRVPDFRQHQR